MVRKQKIVDGITYQMTRFIIRCDMCFERVESVEPEVVVSCLCGNLSIRGGIEYGGQIACTHEIITDFSEWEISQKTP
jgi:hypothetical protein